MELNNRAAMLDVINSLLLAGQLEMAEARVKSYGLKMKIVREGDKFKLVDVSDTTEAWLARYITQDEKMLSLKEDIRKLAKIDNDHDQLFTILIQGPTGTGKELIARALHGEREARFQAINCGGLPETLIESELFGYEKGAFTGATEPRTGLLKSVGDGTIFLDEIGELPLLMQSKLLRAIQQGEVRKVGGNKNESIKCRIICATNKPVDSMIHSNEFRPDLYARISTFELQTIALSERPKDITLILQSLPHGNEFIKAYLTNLEVPIETEEAMLSDIKIESIPTPFNVRSLQQHVKRFKVLGKLPSQP